MDDDNLLADYDLSAWDAPPPPAGLADRVVRLAREPMPQPKPRSLRPWLVAGGALAALVAVLAFALWGIERAPANGSGVVATSQPRTLELGPTSAALDAGAQLTWTRHGSAITVAHTRGGVTWRVAGDDKLSIDATVASIEATGASLRVEVEMNRSDVRAMGVGSAAAIAVSLVTVVVYEGHVKATSNGQTVNIQPGASMQFGAPPAPPTPPTPQDQLNVGGTPEDQARIRELEAEVQRLQRELAKRDKTPDPKDGVRPDPKTDSKTDGKADAKTVAKCDEVSCVLNNYDAACCAKYKRGTCDADALAKKGEDFFGQGKDAAALAQFEKSLDCEADPLVVKKAFLAACRSKNEPKAKRYFQKIPAAQHATYSQVCLRNGIDLKGSQAACDAAALKEKGDDYLGQGMDTAALQQFEASLRCKFDPSVVKTAFLAACRSKQPTKAKLYYAKLPAGQGDAYAQICLRFGITVP